MYKIFIEIHISVLKKLNHTFYLSNQKMELAQSIHSGNLIIEDQLLKTSQFCLICQSCHNKIPQLEGLNNRNLFLLLWRLKSKMKSDSRLVFLRPLSLAYRQQPSLCVLVWPSLGVSTSIVSPCESQSPLLISPQLSWIRTHLNDSF